MARYLWGLALLAIAVVPVVVAAHVWRDRLLPIRNRSTAILADAVLSLSALVLLAELLGTLHEYRRAPIAVLFACVGLAAWWFARSRPSRVDAPNDEVHQRPSLEGDWSEPSNRGGPPVVVLAVAAMGILAASWLTRTVDAYNHGMTNTDTLWYHMPFAARFAQTASITSLHFVDANPVIPFYPANSELFHALGIIFMGNDVLSPLLNLGWLGLLLLAAWCAGRRFGVGWLSVMGAAVLLDTPGLVATQPGGAYTDIVGLALLLASVAFLIDGEGAESPVRRYSIGLAALAAGLALGTKFTLVAPVALLTVGVVVVARRGRRLEEGGVWVLLVALVGGYWYVRNVLFVGNPLPSLSSIGPIHLSSPHNAQPSSTVAHYLFKRGIWSQFYIPGLRTSLGPGWWAVLLIAAIGIVGMIALGRGSLHRMLGIVALGCVLAFLVTPQFLGTKTQPIFFTYNVRYAAPGVLLGLALLPLIPPLATRLRLIVLGGALLAVLLATQLDPTLWPIDVVSRPPFSPPESVGESLVGAAIGLGLVAIAALWLALKPRRLSGQTRGVALFATTLLVAAIVLVGYPLQRHYLANRYTNAPPAPSPKVAAWAQHVHNARIAIIGSFSILQYPYYGRDSTNFVQYLVRIGPTSNLFSYESCRAWRTALYRGRYNYVIASSADEITWTTSDPSARPVSGQAFGGKFLFLVYHLAPGLDLRSCRG